MTTIAWDGRTLAADRQVSFGGGRMGESAKIARRGDGALIGCAGVLGMADALRQWFLDGEQGPRPRLEAGADNTCAAFIVRPDGAIDHISETGVARIESAQFAIGSGADYALGAMSMGADARRAVEVAMGWDNGSGGGIDVLSIGASSAAPRQRFAATPPTTDGTIVDAYDPLTDTWFLARFVQGLWYECNPAGVPVTPRTFSEWRPRADQAA